MSITSLRLAAGIGGLAFIAEGATELAHTQAHRFASVGDYLIEAALAAGLLLTLAGLLALHLRQERDTGQLGAWSFRVAAAGQGALGVVALATLLRGHDALGPVFPIALVAWLLGTVVFAFATYRAAVLPRWVAPTLPVAIIVSVALGHGGTIALGAAWLVLAGALLGDRHALRPAIA